MDNTRQSKLEYTYNLIASLSDDELDAVQMVATTFLKNKRFNNQHGVDSLNAVVAFKPQTEETLLSRIDNSLSQIEEGLYREAESVENELLAGIDS